MKQLHMTAFILLVIGGLNWLLTAFGWNIVDKLLGQWPVVVSAVYVLIGLSAVYEAIMHKQNCRYCGAGGSSSMSA